MDIMRFYRNFVKLSGFAKQVGSYMSSISCNRPRLTIRQLATTYICQRKGWSMSLTGPKTFCTTCRLSSIKENKAGKIFNIEASDTLTKQILAEDFHLYEDFLSDEEEQSLYDELQPYLRKLRYEVDHWDNAIQGYRETERRQWNKRNSAILQRVRECAFPPGTPQLSLVHVLDLQKTGHIKPHIDSVRFCGNTIAGLCLLSDSVMRLQHDKNKDSKADVLLKRKSLYILKDRSRYEYSHAILPEEDSIFRGQVIPRDRRISVICRNEPDPYTATPE